MRKIVMGEYALPQRATAWLVFVALALWLSLWWFLAHGPLALGAHRWDDARYATRAVQGAFDAGIRNRYVHVWGLRAFFTLIDDRLTATISYASIMGLGLITVAFALGRQVGGLRCGLLAALLIPFYPPVFRYFTAPMSDPPSTLYAALALLAALSGKTPRHQTWMAMASGLLCLASIKSKESGVAVVPAVWWALLHNRHGVRSLLYWGAGAVAGQIGLCVIDLGITGDAWISLRREHHQNYAKLLTTDPKRYRDMRNLMRHEWLELLAACDMRNFSLCALLGLAVGIRRQRTLFSLALWALASLLFSSWVSFRYSGIDARMRYMIMFAIPACVSAAYLLTDLFSREPQSLHSSPDATDRLARGLHAGGVLIALWFAYRGLQAGMLHVLDRPMDFAHQRAEFFLLPLVVPAFLFIAWTTRKALLRRASILVIVLTIGVSALPGARDYVAGHQRLMHGWQQLAQYVDAHHLSKFAHYRTRGDTLDSSLLGWRMSSLSHANGMRQRIVAQPRDLAPDEILIVPRRDRPMAFAAGLKLITEVYQSNNRFAVFDRADR